MKALPCAVAAFFAECFVSSSFADVLRVPEDYPTVPSAIDAAASGDSVLVGPGTWTDRIDRVISIPGGGTYLFTSCGFLKGGITVIGTAGPDATIIDGGTTGPGIVNTLMLVNYIGQTCTLEGLAITGGEESAVAAVDAGKMIIRNCRINDSHMVDGGIAVRIDTCDLVLEDSEVSFNTGGYGIGQGPGVLEVRRCKIEANEKGGLGWDGQTNLYDRVTIEDCVFAGHRWAGGTVGIRFLDALNDELLIQRNQFIRNVILSGAGACLAVIGNVSVGCEGVIRFNTFAYDTTYTADAAGGLLAAFFNGEISNNTFFGCYADDPGFEATGSAVGLYSGSSMVFKDNVIAHSRGQPAVQIQGNADQFLIHSCNVFWDNSNGHYYANDTPPPPDILGDPLFCDPAVFDFTVRANSPCAPGNSPGCGAIGAWPVGCGSISVESKSWGQIKSLYR